MPWQKTFDVDDAIDRATEVFWAKGYKAASLSDLMKAIGINKGSFYNAFRSKKALFIRSLIKYERERRHDAFAQFERLDDPVEAISRLFDMLIEQSLTDADKKGCFLVNTALDLPNHDSDIQDAVTKGLKDTEAFFERQISKGIDMGSIPKHIDAQVSATGLLTLLVGLRVLARGVFDQEGLTAIKTQALRLIQ